MTKTILAAVPLAVLALAAPASARDGRDHTIYRAALAPVAVEAPAAEAPAASASRKHRAKGKGVRGGAELRDGARRDRVDLRIHGLESRTAYRWEVRKAAEGEDACAGETVAELVYGELNTRRRGGGKARAFSRSFTAESGAVYAVVVSTTDAVDVACGVFKSKAELKRAKAERKAEEKAAKRKGEDGGSDDDESKDGEVESDESGDDDPAGVDEAGGDLSTDDGGSADDGDVSVDDSDDSVEGDESEQD
jgi:hypothetical protein